VVLVVVEMVVMVHQVKQQHLAQQTLEEVVAQLAIMELVQATEALELSSFVTLHHNKRLLPQQEALR
jgi:hypothetical protein